MVLALCIIVLLLILSICYAVYITIQWFEAEMKLAKFGQSKLHKKLQKSSLYKMIANLFNTNQNDK